MAVQQRWEERHDEQTTTVAFLVDGPTDSAGVRSELLANIPTTYDWRILNKVESIDLLEGQLSLWIARVRYAAFQEKRNLQSGEMEFRFETGTVPSRRTISISSRVFDADGLIDPPPPDAQIIGWDPQAKKAAGTPVDERAYSFGWTVIVPFSTASESWRRQAGELVRTVCNSTFFGYAAGEVRLDSLTGNVRASDDYRFELRFSRRPNFSSLTIGGLSVTNIKGWEHLDIENQKFVTDDKGRLIPKVTRVKVHQLYPEVSWSLLGTLLGV